MAKSLTQEDLIKKRDELKIEFDKMNDVISEYEMGADSFSEAKPSKELALMEALARQSYDESRSLQPSNIAAQLAMVMDPSFAPIYKDATTARQRRPPILRRHGVHCPPVSKREGRLR